MYCTDEDTVNALPNALFYVGRRGSNFPGSRSDVQVIVDWSENSNPLTFWMYGGAREINTSSHDSRPSLRIDDRLATFAFLAP